MDILTLIVLISSGAFAGFLAGLLGIGGGIVLVPALYYAHSISGQTDISAMHMAVGTSLAIIVPTGFSSALAHWRRQAIRFDILAKLAPGVVMGAAIGVVIAGLLNADQLKLIFAIAISVLALYMVLSPEPENSSAITVWPGPRINTLASAFIGLISTLIGIGGATLSVPYMCRFSTKMKEAVGTASVIGLLISIPGACGFATLGMLKNHVFSLTQVGYINILAFIIITPVSIIAAPYGARYAHALSPETLKRLFALLMILVAVTMIFETI